MKRFTLKSKELRYELLLVGTTVDWPPAKAYCILSFDPPIFVPEYGEQHHSALMIVPRYAGDNLSDISSSRRISVNVCVPSTNGDWDNGPWRTLDIAEAWETE